jgi:hypothetical protein
VLGDGAREPPFKPSFGQSEVLCESAPLWPPGRLNDRGTQIAISFQEKEQKEGDVPIRQFPGEESQLGGVLGTNALADVHGAERVTPQLKPDPSRG